VTAMTIFTCCLFCRADRESGSFWSGVAIGGVVCGVLGFVFAPQISQALLGDDQRLRLPRFLDEEDDDPEVTKQNLAEKIAQLNSAIDDVSSQLKARETMDEEVTA
jgi:gas vesicle protein